MGLVVDVREIDLTILHLHCVARWIELGQGRTCKAATALDNAFPGGAVGVEVAPPTKPAGITDGVVVSVDLAGVVAVAVSEVFHVEVVVAVTTVVRRYVDIDCVACRQPAKWQVVRGGSRSDLHPGLVELSTI